MKLPDNHAQRYVLSNEVHARPPVPLQSPVTLSYIALMTDWPYSKDDRDHVVALAGLHGVEPPPRDTKHTHMQLDGYGLIWERHTEFTRFTFIADSDPLDPFGEPALKKVPQDWLANLPGEVIAAANLSMVPHVQEGEDWPSIAQRYFNGNAIVGSRIAGGAGIAITDFRIHDDDFSRILVLDRTMSPWHAGRITQRLLEIEVYRVMALLALPVAQGLNPGLKAAERDLTEITTQMTTGDPGKDQQLLSRLMKLQASVERSVTESQYRFSAAAAYDAIVSSRIAELREERIVGMQTFKEFVDRRLAPALATCHSVAERQRDFSERVERASQLLLTQVEMSLQRQNQAILASMDERAALQLRLQKTVEGLSIAAVTYYVLGVVAYLLKGLMSSDEGLSSDKLVALSVPLILALVAFTIWRTRQKVEDGSKSVGRSSGVSAALDPYDTPSETETS